MMNSCIFILFFFVGTAVAQDCDFLQNKYCPYAMIDFSEITNENVFCRRYKDFDYCFHTILPCQKYYDFVYFETCEYSSKENDSSRPEIKFKTVLFTAITIMLPMHI
ncbi:uncharacterized protein LOC128249874 [Octopus bimaculoides]|uniref:uncharacterized protein LOC128249874 n=1 Tax=Octopus bimaculoides TaxID=37653 RepID=UPI0022E312C2|nr:uncharacterized protein LOC128249874 [Octopus bimaculoides]